MKKKQNDKSSRKAFGWFAKLLILSIPLVIPCLLSWTMLKRSNEWAGIKSVVASTEAQNTDPASDAVGQFDKSKYKRVNFDTLGGFYYDTEWPSATAALMLPKNVRSLNNTKVAVEGFMLPVAVDEQKVKSFVLLADQNGCCFGVMPQINRWIAVNMSGSETTKRLKDVPLLIYGTLHISEGADPNMGLCLYRLSCDQVEISDSQPAKRFWLF